MNINKYLTGFLAGYMICLLLVYLAFDYFSWSFTAGSLADAALFALLIKRGGKKGRKFP
ncbi:hypothetical protein [Pseudobacillus badius]|uniref:hypothetical protein n=1 Tax=Bacillus badius TaxID=1455 RepID=UPI000AA0E4B3|nr:hypothetical protein [Bacillus badius]